MTTRLDDLRARLLGPDVVLEDIWDYIATAHPPLRGQIQQALPNFVNEGDIGNFRWLEQWWAPVKEKPTTLPTPTIAQFCWFVNYAEGSPPVTFDMALKQFYERALAHCEAADLDKENPGETAEERRKRRNRERMAEVRGHRRVPNKLIRGNAELTEQVRALEAEIEAVRVQAKEVDDGWREQVVRHQTAMIQSSAGRKESAAQFKQRVDNIRSQIKQLTAKQ